jgi:hypothetical protein
MEQPGDLHQTVPDARAGLSSAWLAIANRPFRTARSLRVRPERRSLSVTSASGGCEVDLRVEAQQVVHVHRAGVRDRPEHVCPVRLRSTSPISDWSGTVFRKPVCRRRRDAGDPRQAIADLVAAILDPVDEASRRDGSPVSRPSWVIARSTWRMESPGTV